jgi:hypothetical protein
MLIENGRVSVTLDDMTGNVVRVEDRRTRRVHFDARAEGRDDGRLFRLIVPTPGWRSRYVDSGRSEPTLMRGAGSARLHFRNLLAEGETTSVHAEVHIEAPADADDVRFTIMIENKGRLPVTEVRFPWLGGWRGLGGRGKDTVILGAHTEFDPHSFPLNTGATYARSHQRATFTYPIDLYAPWFDVSGPDGGMSCINYMKTPLNSMVALENLAGYGPGPGLSFSWAYPVCIRSGERWTSPAVAISFHDGDWRETADRYRLWSDTWRRTAPGPRAARVSIGYQNVFFRGFDGTPFRSLESLRAVAEEGRKYGVDQLVVWDHLMLGQYARTSDTDLLEYPFDERRALTETLTRLKREGTNVSAIMNFRLANPAFSIYKNELYRDVIRNIDGSERQENYPGSHSHASTWTRNCGPVSMVLSPHAGNYRLRVSRLVRDYLRWGFTSLFFDQPFERWADYGHVEQGGRPEATHQAAVELLANVRALLQHADPEALMIGEFCDVFAAQHVDLWMSWYRDFAPALRAAYAFPQTMHSWVVDSDAAQASHAFAAGMYLCLCTHGMEATLAAEPELGQHVLALAWLRKKCAARTVLGQFRGTRGIQVESDNGAVAYSYDAPTGPAVIAAAPKGPAKLRVTLDRAAFAGRSMPGPAHLHRLDGSGAEVSGDTQEIVLGANEVAVWEA